MIRNNLPLSSQKLNNTMGINRNNVKRFITQPNRIRQLCLQTKLRQSQDNLFNFIKDSII